MDAACFHGVCACCGCDDWRTALPQVGYCGALLVPIRVPAALLPAQALHAQPLAVGDMDTVSPHRVLTLKQDPAEAHAAVTAVWSPRGPWRQLIKAQLRAGGVGLARL